MSSSYLENIYSIGTEVGDFKIINHTRKYYSNGSKLILICKCNICNYEWEEIAKNVVERNNCPKCKKNLKSNH